MHLHYMFNIPLGLVTKHWAGLALLELEDSSSRKEVVYSYSSVSESIPSTANFVSVPVDSSSSVSRSISILKPRRELVYL